MHYFEIDWLHFMETLPLWEKVDTEIRRIFIEKAEPVGLVDPSAFGLQLPPLLEVGLVAISPKKEWIKLYKKAAAFHRGLAAIGMVHIYDGRKDEKVLEIMGEYLRRHFSQSEVVAFSCGQERYIYFDYRRQAATLSSGNWLKQFLEAETPEEWERRYAWPANKLYLLPEHIFNTARIILRHLMSVPEPVSFRNLPSMFPDINLSLIAAAIGGGIRYAIFFPDLRARDLEPIIGIWPSISRYLHRSRPQFPKGIKPKETFESSILMEDMTTVMVACSQEPFRMRLQDETIYARDQRDIAKNMVKIPKWLEIPFRLDESLRIALAVNYLKSLKLVKTEHNESGMRMAPTDQGREWIKKTGKERLRFIIDTVKEHTEILTSYGYYGIDESACYFLPVVWNILIDENMKVNVAQNICDVFNALKSGDFFDLDDFLNYEKTETNPFLYEGGNSGAIEIRDGYSIMTASNEMLEKVWREMLSIFVIYRLILLGGASVGPLKKKFICFSVNDIGRYLTGKASDFEYGHKENGEVVVQPNFDVVFLSPSPLVETEIGRFAERKGSGIGVLFRITKKSIIQAASVGWNYKQVDGKLRQIAKKDIPKNVDREIRGWFQQCRRVAMRSSIIIQCPDKETASRVLSTGGRDVEMLTDTIVEFKDRAKGSAIVRKLHNAGIFIDKVE
ncbi:MAG: helicase-associated domain-containing protein [Syntrophaceae bacterium]|nr:helicase-associated domain-containing protein [Syntrophaceae bacterium]